MSDDPSTPPSPAGRIHALIERITHFVKSEVWRTDVHWPRSLFYRVGRVVLLAIHGLQRTKAGDSASALSYITVLSLVPLLAFALSVAKGFGAYDYLLRHNIRPFLDYAFGAIAEPPADGVPDAAVDAVVARSGGALEIRYNLEDLLDVINQTDFASLGVFGFVVLLVTVIRLLMTIELALNEIWGVRKGRRLLRRVSDYVAIVVIAPLLTITATAATGAGAERVIRFLGLNLDLQPLFKVVVLLVIWVVFALVYLIMPNTRVSLVSACIGGMVGGSAFHGVQLLFVWFQREVANYSAIYAGFAAVPVFLVWLLICWVTVLLGAHVAWAHEAEPALRQSMRDGPLTHAGRERLALRLVHAIAGAFVRGDSVITARSMAAKVAMPVHVVDELLAPLVQRGMLSRTAEKTGHGYLPARDLERIRVLDVIDAISGRGPDRPSGQVDPVEEALHELRRAELESIGNRTLGDLAR